MAKRKERFIGDVVWSPQGNYILASDTNPVTKEERLWAIDPDKAIWKTVSSFPNLTPITHKDFSPDGQWLAMWEERLSQLGEADLQIVFLNTYDWKISRSVKRRAGGVTDGGWTVNANGIAYFTFLNNTEDDKAIILLHPNDEQKDYTLVKLEYLKSQLPKDQFLILRGWQPISK